MDPARPTDPDPADPFFPERADHAILETIEIATEGEDCDECVRKLRPVLKKIPGVQDVKVDLPHERVIVTFDPRKTHPPDLHDAILKSGYKPAPSRIEGACGRARHSCARRSLFPTACRGLPAYRSDCRNPKIPKTGHCKVRYSNNDLSHSRLLLRQAVERAQAPD